MASQVKCDRLKQKIKERGENCKTLSQKTGIPLKTLQNRLSGRTVFNMDELVILCEVLTIRPTEIMWYFFN